MAKSSTAKGKKTRPAKKRPLPSAAAKKNTAVKTSRPTKKTISNQQAVSSARTKKSKTLKKAASKEIDPASKATRKHTIRKQNLAKKSKPAASSHSKPKKPKATKQLHRQIVSLPLGRRLKLVVALSRPQPEGKKRKLAAKSQAKSSKNSRKLRQYALTAVFLLVGLAGVIFYGKQALVPLQQSSGGDMVEQKTATFSTPPTKQALERSPPLKLRAPAIKLNAPLAKVGLQPNGSIEVPDYTKAGWYNMSPTPGEIGPSVIVGHLDNINGTAVFWRLNELDPGQIVEVDRQDGKTAKFVIERVKYYPQEKFPTSEVYGNIDQAGLRLITCSGTFNHQTQRYSGNTVIFASLVPEKLPEVPIMKQLSFNHPIVDLGRAPSTT